VSGRSAPPGTREREILMFEREGIVLAKEQMRVTDGLWRRVEALIEGDLEAVGAMLAGFARTIAAAMPGTDARALLTAMVGQVPHNTEVTAAIVELALARLEPPGRLGALPLKPTES
jgi:hypothetical protein